MYTPQRTGAHIIVIIIRSHDDLAIYEKLENLPGRCFLPKATANLTAPLLFYTPRGIIILFTRNIFRKSSPPQLFQE